MRYQYVIRVNIEAENDGVARMVAQQAYNPEALAKLRMPPGVHSLSTKLQRVYPDRNPVKVKW